MDLSLLSVFVSYAHDSEEHKQFVLNYSDWLNNPGGIECWIDRYVEDADIPEGWHHWMRRKIRDAGYVLVVCSPKYHARFNQEEQESGKGLGVKFESTLILADFYTSESLNIKFIPVVTQKDHHKYIIDILLNQPYYDLSDETSRDSLYRRLTKQPKHPKPEKSSGIIILKQPKSTTEKQDEPLTNALVSIPELPQYSNMKPGTKILQTFFALSATKRFAIAKELELVEGEESLESPDLDKIFATFLERAYQRGLMSELWSKLFDESIDPNPFKKTKP